MQRFLKIDNHLINMDWVISVTKNTYKNNNSSITIDVAGGEAKESDTKFIVSGEEVDALWGWLCEVCCCRIFDNLKIVK